MGIICSNGQTVIVESAEPDIRSYAWTMLFEEPEFGHERVAVVDICFFLSTGEKFILECYKRGLHVFTGVCPRCGADNPNLSVLLDNVACQGFNPSFKELFKALCAFPSLRLRAALRFKRLGI